MDRLKHAEINMNKCLAPKKNKKWKLCDQNSVYNKCKSGYKSRAILCPVENEDIWKGERL